ncbi:MAG: hypothetical protein ACLUFN_00050 [Eubacterium sp.]
MKTRLSKKVISVILSVLMVLTAMPMTVFASIDSVDGIDGVDENTIPLLEAITAYENKMDGTVYTNMYAAYTAYVQAHEAYDSYVYGDSNIDLTAYTSALTTATENMTSWTKEQANAAIARYAAPFGSEDNSTSPYATPYYKNVLYTTQTSSSVASVEANANVRKQVYYSTATLLYDGLTTPALPVMASGQVTLNKTRYMYATYPSDANGNDFGSLALEKGWQGGTGANTMDWSYAYTKLTGSNGGYNYATGFQGNQTTTYRSEKLSTGTFSSSRKINYYANILDYTGGSAAFNGSYYIELKPYWYMVYSDGANSSNDPEIASTSTTIAVVNYKALTDAIESADNKNKLKLSGGNYTQGGAATLLKAYDAATSLNVNDYVSSSTNNYTGLASAISTAVSGLSATTTADVSGYDALRKAITDTRATYNSTSSDKYTADSWNNFTAAYEAAQSTMINLLSTGYNDAANAQKQADALLAAMDALEVDFTPADTTELVKVIDDASVAISNKDYFTADSYNAGNFEANVTAAKIAVWGSEDAYKDPASTIDDDNQSVVDTWEATIGEAIMALVIDRNAVVASAKGYSMNSAIEYAGTFKSADYANYDKVTQAITNCNNFAVSITIREPGAVAAKVAEYRNLVEELIMAIHNLQPAFSNLANGTVVNAGNTETSVVSYSHTSGAVTYDSSLTWKRPNNTVFFRTTHDAASFDIGTSNFTWYTNRDYDQYLETLNFAALTTLTTGELSANANYSGAVSDYDGSLGVYSSAGGQYNWNNFKVTGFTGANGSNYTGKDLNGTGYILSDNYDYTNDLLKAQNDYQNPCGGIISHKGDTYFTADGTISLASTSSKNLTLATLPTSKEYPVNATLGYFQYYKYQPFTVYAGYAYTQNSYSQSATIIDISYLIDLINTVDALNYLEYTASSWADLEAALKAAKADMDYGNMSVTDITNACVERYTNLYNAWKALDSPLSNQVIKDAVAEYAELYNTSNREGKYSAASWSDFTAAYTAAYNSINNNGQYSDINIRNVDATDENTAVIAKVAQDVIDAYNALVAMADFSGLIAAAGTAIENYAYCVADLQALADVIDSSTYLKYTAEQKAVTYEDEQSAIDAQTNAIISAINALTKKEAIDTSALDAAKDRITSDAEDPDAWDGIDAAKSYIDSVANAENLYSAVTVYNATVYGINYTQDDTDTVVTEALSMLTPQYYTVTVIDQDGNTSSDSYLYGTSVNIKSITGNKVDWYYSYKSNTAENTEKYYTTDSNINFVVKGNTTLRTTEASDTIGKVKVTYVSSISNAGNKVVAVDYVAPGSTVSQLPVQPTVAYYTATGYTYDGSEFTTSTVINQNITVVANYEAVTSSPVYTVTWSYLDDDAIPVESSATYEYNDEVTLTFAEADYWVQFYSEDAYNSWINLDENVGELEYVVFYGNTYTFRAHEDVYIAALRASDTEYDIDAGYLDANTMNSCSVRVAEDLVYVDDKFSMIGTYTMPDDCTLVEAGILFAKGQGYDLTLNNVDNSTIYRLKSSKHTVGNQFVISIKSANVPNGQQMQFASYLIYKDSNGQSHTIISNPVNATYQA